MVARGHGRRFRGCFLGPGATSGPDRTESKIENWLAMIVGGSCSMGNRRGCWRRGRFFNDGWPREEIKFELSETGVDGPADLRLAAIIQLARHVTTTCPPQFGCNA